MRLRLSLALPALLACSFSFACVLPPIDGANDETGSEDPTTSATDSAGTDSDGTDSDGTDTQGTGDGDGCGPSEPPPTSDPLGPEDNLEACMDGLDNDGNGFVDCGDFGCSMSMDQAILDYCAMQPTEDTLEACMDGIDNDCNGFRDCDDFSCSMAEDQAIVDYCENIAENTVEKCSDMIDNDGDGFVDCEDFDCSMSDDPEVAALCG